MDEANGTTYHQFQKVFEEYYNPLCNYAFTFLKDLSSSEDVVQELFVKVWEKRQDLITSDTIRFYLFTAVRNNSLTFLQREKKAAIVELNDYDAPDEQFSFTQETKSAPDYRSQLSAAINELPPKCKEVFLLSRMSKQSYKEIADTLNISVKTVENQIGKALKILRHFVKEQKVFVWLLILLHLFK